jgi:hypothetical protein
MGATPHLPPAAASVLQEAIALIEAKAPDLAKTLQDLRDGNIGIQEFAVAMQKFNDDSERIDALFSKEELEKFVTLQQRFQAAMFS